MATTVQVIAAFLAGAGVRRIYGVPGGGSTLDVIEAGRQRQIEFLLTHHEAGAAIMAATEGDLLDRPGTCLAALGPGVASAVNGVAHAYLDRVPLLLLTDRSSRLSRRLAAPQGLDHPRIVEAVAKDSATITAPRAERLLHWAWGKALAVPPGPVHLDLPADEANREARRHARRLARDRPPTPSPSAIRAAARLLARRGRVVVIAGLGCRGSRAARALQELVEHLGSPLLTTYRAKGAVAEDHPLAAGVFVGGRLEEELLSKADAVLAVGLDPVELLPRPWRAGLPVVALAEYRTGQRPYEAAAEVIADLPTALGALREAFPPGGAWGLAEWAGRGAEFKAKARSLLAEASMGRGRTGLPPHRVVEVAREIFPRQTVAAVDSGTHALAVAAFWESYEPKGYLCSSGLATAGYALPAAIAAKLTFPDRPVLAFLGDGGFLRSVADLATAAWQRLPLVAIVFADSSLGLSRVQQEQRRYAPVGVSLGAMDIPKLAESLGALGTEVEDEEGLRSALKDAVTTTQPAIIAARVRPTGYRRMLEILRGKGGGE
jgi:acetolactate synthase-1/2/3 large subunit